MHKMMLAFDSPGRQALASPLSGTGLSRSGQPACGGVAPPRPNHCTRDRSFTPKQGALHTADSVGNAMVRYRTSGYQADITFDKDGFVTLYQDYLERVG